MIDFNFMQVLLFRNYSVAHDQKYISINDIPSGIDRLQSFCLESLTNHEDFKEEKNHIESVYRYDFANDSFLSYSLFFSGGCVSKSNQSS